MKNLKAEIIILIIADYYFDKTRVDISKARQR